MNHLAFESFGVRVGVSTNDIRVLERLREITPPGARDVAAAEVEHHFSLTTDDGTRFHLAIQDIREGEVPLRGALWDSVGLDLELALGLLDTHLRGCIAVQAPDLIFVHAGTVAHRGRAIVLPGMTFAGKTTLVAALVGAGATYYSDEYAPLDENGWVHPYAKPLSLRDRNHTGKLHTVESLGGVAGEEPLPIGAVVVTTYRPGADWRPQRRSSGEGVLALLGNTVPAQTRPAQALRVLGRGVADAIVIESNRGEADAVAPLILAELERELAADGAAAAEPQGT